jgi:translation elongation factor P/translation initiation factor 5A
MKLQIIDTNFSNEAEWLFKLLDEQDEEYFIMQNEFYKRFKLSSPITKRELDSLFIGTRIEASTIIVEQKRIVLKIEHYNLAE